MAACAPLPPEIAELVVSGVSITLASRDERLVPSIAKGVGCRVAAGRDRVTVLVMANGAEELLRDVARCGRVAVTFSRPTTNQTVQLKGRDAAAVPTLPADVALVRRHLALLAEDLRLLGWDAAFVEAVFWRDPGALQAIEFAPEHAFQQTPGPGAGRPIGDAAAGGR